jgi:cytochrome c biogenesis protein CcdA
LSRPDRHAPSVYGTAAFAVIAVSVLGVVALLGVGRPLTADGPFTEFLPALTPLGVVGAGLLDGINPCAFTVLLLLIAALLATMQAGNAGTVAVRARVVLLGSVYVAAVFVTYLALGVGVLAVGRTFTASHLPSRIGALVAVVLGLWMLKDVFLPGLGPRLEAPHGMTKRAHTIARKATIPSLVLGGVLIGLCTVPCSGAVYLAVLSLLAAQSEPLTAYAYLVVYNLLFVLPLILILVVASARGVLARLARWQERNRERVRFAIGTSVVGLGLALLATI